MISDLPIFVAIVEAGSFVQAAKNLNTTQATVSRRLQALEEALGFNLIKRNTRNFEITPFGQSLYTGVKTQQEHLEQLISHLKDTANGAEGILRVSLPSVISYDIITPYIPQFLQKNPGVTLQISYQNREIDILKEGYDLAIVNYRPAQQTLKIRLLHKLQYKFYCTPSYKEAYGIPNNLEECQEHLLTGAVNSDATVNKLIQAFHQDGSQTMSKNQARLRHNNALHGKQFTLSGHVIGGGWDMLYQQELNNGSVIPVLPEYSFGELSFYLVRPDSYNNLLLNLFIDFINECFERVK